MNPCSLALTWKMHWYSQNANAPYLTVNLSRLLPLDPAPLSVRKRRISWTSTQWVFWMAVAIGPAPDADFFTAIRPARSLQTKSSTPDLKKTSPNCANPWLTCLKYKGALCLTYKGENPWLMCLKCKGALCLNAQGCFIHGFGVNSHLVQNQ